MKRNEAAKELNAIFNIYETRKNQVSTTYRKIFKDRSTGNWRLIGRMHNYIV